MISVCPVEEIEAPLEQVWPLLVDPPKLDLWWGAKVQRVSPPGVMVPGQIIEAGPRALSRLFYLRLEVEEVDHAQHRLALLVSLPLGITDRTVISCVPLGPTRCRVSYG